VITHSRFDIQLSNDSDVFSYLHSDDSELNSEGPKCDVLPWFVTSLTRDPDVDLNQHLVDRLCVEWVQHRPDVVHLHFTTGVAPIVVEACEALSLPVVVTLHGMTNLVPVNGSFVRAGIAPNEVLSLLKRCQRVVVVSKPMLDYCASNGLHHVTKISSGIDTAYFTQGDGPPRADILYVGKRNEHKGLRETIEGYLASCAVQEHALNLVGRGIDAEGFSATGFGLTDLHRATVADMIQAGRIRLFGELSPELLRQLYRECKLLVLPSHSEGFPLVILEALACGAPVVASEVGSISEIVRDNENGFCIAAGDIKALSTAIDRLLIEEAEHREAACRRAAERYDIASVANAYRSEFEMIATKMQSLAR
jgi:glycosyltransferase involved in cell wall biosynthesis